MPRYTESDLKEALQAVQTGVSIRRAAKLHGVPRNTIADRIHGAASRKDANEVSQRLSRLQEEHLSQWILAQDALKLPPTHQQVRDFTQRVLAAHGDTQPLGKRWIEGFLRRNPAIKHRKSKPVDSALTNGATDDTATEDGAAIEDGATFGNGATMEGISAQDQPDVDAPTSPRTTDTSGTRRPLTRAAKRRIGLKVGAGLGEDVIAACEALKEMRHGPAGPARD